MTRKYEEFYPQNINEGQKSRIQKLYKAFDELADNLGMHGCDNYYRKLAFNLLEQAAAMATKSVTHREIAKKS